MSHQHNVLVAAAVTPMHPDGSIKLSAIPDFIDHLIRTGVKGVFVNGSTGEWCSLSCDERKSLAEEWIRHGRGKLDNIIIHCGASSLADAKCLAKHASDIGADAIGCISPCFFKPHSEEHLVDYLADVASVAPTTPFLYYHIPPLTNIEMKMEMETFLSLACKKIPTFSGLKATTFDFHDVYQCLEFVEKPLSVYYGIDTQILPALVMGVKGAIGHFYNFLGTEYNEIIQLFHDGDLKSARDKQIKISLDIQTLLKTYGNSVIKVMTSLISGIQMGPNRLPMKNDFSDTEVKEIRQQLLEKGYIRDN